MRDGLGRTEKKGRCHGCCGENRAAKHAGRYVVLGRLEVCRTTRWPGRLWMSQRQWKSLSLVAKSTRSLRVCSSVAAGNWSLEVIEQGWTCYVPIIQGALQTMCKCRLVFRSLEGWWLESGESTTKRAYKQLDVLWAESPHKVHQEVTGASVIEILLLPEMRNELSKHKIWIDSSNLDLQTVLPYLGKVCCFMRPDYIGQSSLALPRGHWELLKCYAFWQFWMKNIVQIKSNKRAHLEHKWHCLLFCPKYWHIILSVTKIW